MLRLKLYTQTLKNGRVLVLDVGPVAQNLDGAIEWVKGSLYVELLNDTLADGTGERVLVQGSLRDLVILNTDPDR